MDQLFRLSPSKTEANQVNTRRHTPGLSVDAQVEPTLEFNQEAGAKLKRWRRRVHDPQQAYSGAESQVLSQQDNLSDFYAEVDERMSHNSLEYPVQQARYIDRWLADSTAGRGARCSSGMLSKSFDDSQQGQFEPGTGPNVIGIRGFSSESFLADESKRCHENYARLKQDYLRLQVDHRKLRARLHQTGGDMKSRGGHHSTRPSCELPQVGDNVDSSLKALVIEQGRRLEETMQAMNGARFNCDRCRCPRVSSCQLVVTDSAVGNETAALEIVKELRDETERLRRTIDERRQEVRQLREQVAHLQLEPANRKLLELTSENARLKSTGDTSRVELDALRANYLQLEARLRTLMEGQKSLGQEAGDEMNRMLIELNQFQVSQPKLEMLLDTERQIKCQLQEKITSLLEEREKMQEEMNELADELNETKLRARGTHSNELEKCRAELESWQAKCTRLQEERTNLESLLRGSKLKCAQLDAQIFNEIQVVRETHERQLASVRTEARCQYESETSELRAQVQELANKLAHCDNERRQASKQTLELHRQLELAQLAATSERAFDKSKCKQLETIEVELATCREQLASCAAIERELKSKLELTVGQLEQSRRQCTELKRRFEVQQVSVADQLAGKERELARLRVDLNFERYNRQVSVRGIEKELRSSLRELEAMKCRFSRRLSNGTPLNQCEQSVTKSSLAL